MPKQHRYVVRVVTHGITLFDQAMANEDTASGKLKQHSDAAHTVHGRVTT